MVNKKTNQAINNQENLQPNTIVHSQEQVLNPTAIPRGLTHRKPKLQSEDKVHDPILQTVRTFTQSKKVQDSQLKAYQSADDTVKHAVNQALDSVKPKVIHTILAGFGMPPLLLPPLMYMLSNATGVSAAEALRKISSFKLTDEFSLLCIGMKECFSYEEKLENTKAKADSAGNARGYRRRKRTAGH